MNYHDKPSIGNIMKVQAIIRIYVNKLKFHKSLVWSIAAMEKLLSNYNITPYLILFLVYHSIRNCYIIIFKFTITRFMRINEEWSN